MLRPIIAVCFLLVAFSPAWTEESTIPAKQYQALVEEFEEEGGARVFAKRFLAFAEQHPSDDASIQALVWVIQKIRGRGDTDTALKLLGEHHTKNKKISAACEHIANSRSAHAEPLLSKLLAKSPHKSVQALAGVYLAALLDLEANIADQLKAQPDLAPRVLQYYGKEYGKHLSTLDRNKLEQQREAIYEQLLKSFPDEQVQDTAIEKIASQRLFAIRHLSVGKVAPEIKGEDIAGKEFKLSDYRGKIVMLTFWGHW